MLVVICHEMTNTCILVVFNMKYLASTSKNIVGLLKFQNRALHPKYTLIAVNFSSAVVGRDMLSIRIQNPCKSYRPL